MNEYVSALKYYGYKILEVTYDEWKDELENCVSAGGQDKDQEQHALIPLYRFCVKGLPKITPAPEFDDRSIVSILKDDVENWTGVEESSGYRMSCVDAFTTKCDSLDRLDVVIANAGILRITYEESQDVELTIKAKFLERKEDSIFKAFNQDKKSYVADRYNTSKLVEVLLVRSVTAAIQKGPHAAEPLIFNNVNPGLCHSELDKDVGTTTPIFWHSSPTPMPPYSIEHTADFVAKLQGLASYILTFAKALIAQTAEVGGRTLVHSAATVSESHGQYMSEAKVKEPSAFVRSAEGAKVQGRVHKELMDTLETIQPGIASNI
ncbi:hypothetical protein QQZ08_008290 [Neonectria magnoliae]|uniref:Uncharacterized protein n=1 Tax=Neonectria magnoliae TaxID=2732573 RepID=A0ABR1HWT0_9HYPO